MKCRYAIAIALLTGVPAPAGTAGQQTAADMSGRVATAVGPQSFRWMRTITPPRRLPLAEACVALDAQVFEHAAPALRDLRLYQDGEELPYVVEQSFDERALDSGVTPADDRSLYDISAMGTLQPQPPEPSTGGTSLLKAPTVLGALIALPRQVPVERVRLETVPAASASLGVRAAITQPTLLGGGAETAQGTVDAAHSTLAFTIGANLQAPAEVSVVLAGEGIKPGRVLLEMRRRSLCYHPATASSLTLYLGGDDIAAESYPFARTFQSETDRPYAALGELQPNPAFHPPPPRSFHLTRRAKLLVGGVAFAILFFLNARRLLRKRAPRG